MAQAPARRSIFGVAKERGNIVSFPAGRPKNDADTDRRAQLAKILLKAKFGYDDKEAQLIVDDFLSGGPYSMWTAQIDALVRRGLG